MAAAAASPPAPSIAAEAQAAVTPKPVPFVPFDFSRPPVIDGFSPSSPAHKAETFKEKFLRKFSENPFIPIGCLATAGALVWGLQAFSQGKTRQSQLMMRGRIAAQGFTVVALVVGVVSTALKPKKD